jgi:hypothetical protein
MAVTKTRPTARKTARKATQLRVQIAGTPDHGLTRIDLTLPGASAPVQLVLPEHRAEAAVAAIRRVVADNHDVPAESNRFQAMGWRAHARRVAAPCSRNPEGRGLVTLTQDGTVRSIAEVSLTLAGPLARVLDDLIALRPAARQVGAHRLRAEGDGLASDTELQRLVRQSRFRGSATPVALLDEDSEVEVSDVADPEFVGLFDPID